MFTLYPTTSNIFQGQLLLGVGFIVAMKSTLGATVQNAVRLFLGGAIATCYCLLIVNLCPRTVYFGVGATNVLVLLIVYTDLPVTVRRFSIVPTCIVLLQWITKPHVNTRFVLQVWGSLTLGASLAVLVSCLPMPMVATAYRELTMRMRFLARQTRRETTAILLLISEYHNQHLKSNYDQRSDHGIEMERSASVIQAEEEREHLSSSYENLRDDHLLSSDIQDLNSLVNDEIKQMQRAWNELSNEPYFIALNLWNCLRRLLRHLPGIKRFVSPPSTLETRLGLWVTGFVSLQRTINGMLTLHHHHHAFVGQRQLINVRPTLTPSPSPSLSLVSLFPLGFDIQLFGFDTSLHDGLEELFPSGSDSRIENESGKRSGRVLRDLHIGQRESSSCKDLHLGCRSFEYISSLDSSSCSRHHDYSREHPNPGNF